MFNYMPNKSGLSPNRSMLLLSALVKRRTRRGFWAYIIWLLAWVPLMVFIASFQVRPYQMLLLIPVVVVLVQVGYPTLLGWAVIVMPSVFFTGVMVYFVVVTAPGRVQHDLAGLVISSVAAGIYVLVCVALWYGRPKGVNSAVVEQVAPASGD